MSNATRVALNGEQVLAASMEAMAVVADRKYVSVNQEWVDLFGFERPSELVGEMWADRIVESERDRFEEDILPTCRQEGQWRGEAMGCRRDFEKITLELSIAWLEDEQFVFTARKIDARKDIVTTEDDHSRLLEHVFDAIDDILYVLDEDGNPVIWNEKLVETTGYSDAEIAAHDPKEFIPADQHEFVPGLAEAIDQLEDQHIDLDIVTRDGNRVPHEFRGTTFEDPDTEDVYRCGIARDVHGRNERETELERYQSIVETVDDGVYALDEDLRVSFANSTFCEMVDMSREDLLSTPVTDLFEYDDDVAVAEEIRDLVVAEDTGTGTVRATLQTNGEERTLEARYRLHPEPDGEFRGSVGVMRDVTDREARERDLERERDRLAVLFENVPTPVMYGPTCADGPRIGDVNPAFEEVFGCDAENVTGMPLDDLILPADADNEDLNRRVVEEGSVDVEVQRLAADGVRDFRLQTAVVPLDESPNEHPYEGWAIYTDVTERKERERQLERQHDELDTLNRINNLLLEITRDLFGSPTRDGIEQTVCEELATSDLYQFAWIGAPAPAGDDFVSRASAGIDDGYVEAKTVTNTVAELGQGLAARAYQNGEVQINRSVQTDPMVEPWRDAALDHDIRSAATVPLVHGDTIYGTLAVYADRSFAFRHREKAGLETLGKAVGFAINAIENRRLLFADSIVELEFDVTDPGLVFVRVSQELDCFLSVTGFVASESGDWSVYLTVEGAAPTDVRDVAVEASDVSQVRVIADEEDGGLLEFVMRGAALHELTERGAILTSGSVDAGRGRFCIEVPRSTDVRRLTSRLQAEYPASTLVAQREFDRPARTAVEVRHSLDEQLTDRQREALDRAYHAGYFDWPRMSTAGDVADSMGIAETTFHYHLRNGLDTLLSTLSDRLYAGSH